MSGTKVREGGGRRQGACLGTAAAARPGRRMHPRPAGPSSPSCPPPLPPQVRRQVAHQQAAGLLVRAEDGGWAGHLDDGQLAALGVCRRQWEGEGETRWLGRGREGACWWQRPRPPAPPAPGPAPAGRAAPTSAAAPSPTRGVAQPLERVGGDLPLRVVEVVFVVGPGQGHHAGGEEAAKVVDVACGGGGGGGEGGGGGGQGMGETVWLQRQHRHGSRRRVGGSRSRGGGGASASPPAVPPAVPPSLPPSRLTVDHRVVTGHALPQPDDLLQAEVLLQAGGRERNCEMCAWGAAAAQEARQLHRHACPPHPCPLASRHPPTHITLPPP